MLRFAANVSMLFTEAPFLDRFALAAHAGFAAVECQFPYEAPAAEIGARLRDLGLAMVLHNLPAGKQLGRRRARARVPAAARGRVSRERRARDRPMRTRWARRR